MSADYGVQPDGSFRASDPAVNELADWLDNNLTEDQKDRAAMVILNALPAPRIRRRG